MTAADADSVRRWSLTLLITPVVAAAGFLARPYVSDFTDDAVVAAAITSSPARWQAAAVLMVLGALLLAFALPTAVERVGGTERQVRWVRLGATTGAVGFAVQVGIVGFGGAAAHRVGADVSAFLATSGEGIVIGVSLLGLLVAWVGVVGVTLASDLAVSIRWGAAVGAALGALGHLYPASLGEYIASIGTAAALWALATPRTIGRSRAGAESPRGS